MSTGLPLGGEFCTALEEFELPDGDVIRAGDQITFEDRRYDGKSDQTRTVRVTGTVSELWREDHPNVGRSMFFFEMEDGSRVWVHRDKPVRAQGLDGVLGAAPEGAMF